MLAGDSLPKCFGQSPASTMIILVLDTESANGKLEDVVDKAVPERYRGSAQDRRDMLVHGKKQELRRNFRLLTMTGFASMVNITVYEQVVEYRAN